MRYLIVTAIVLLNLFFLKTAPVTLAILAPFLVVFLVATSKQAPGR